MLRKVNKETKAIALDTAVALIPVLTKELRDTATSADWPDDIIALLTVEWDGSGLSITYPDEIAQEVENLEYGTESDKPNSVLRGFMYRSQSTIKDALNNRTFIRVLDSEELFA